MTTEKTETSTPVHAHCSTVSLMEFQMTVANLAAAEHALREKPYERVPYLAGTLQLAQWQMKSLRQEVMECKRVLGIAMEACRDGKDESDPCDGCGKMIAIGDRIWLHVNIAGELCEDCKTEEFYETEKTWKR